jgi:hypothetical protein
MPCEAGQKRDVEEAQPVGRRGVFFGMQGIEERDDG